MLVVAATCAFVVAVRESDSESVDHRFVIPAGTADRIDAGEPVAVTPPVVHLHSGDTITLVNEDDVVQQTGFLSVRPGETITYRFSEPGRFSSECSFHPDGGLVIDVTA